MPATRPARALPVQRSTTMVIARPLVANPTITSRLGGLATVTAGQGYRFPVVEELW